MKVNANQIPTDEPEVKKKGFGKKGNKKEASKAKANKTTDEAPEKFDYGAAIKEQVNKFKEKAGAESDGDGKFDYGAAIKEQADKIKAKGLLQQNKFWIIVCVVLFFIFISVNSKVSNEKTQLTVKLNRLTKETEDRSTALEQLKIELEEQARIDALKLDEEEEELAKNNAIDQGVHVADLQNMYKKLDAATNPEMFRDNKDALDICFGDDDKNARTPWYSSAGGISGTWEFASKASFVGETARVLWLCYSDDDHTLLAFCTAKYNARTKLFSNVEWNMTAYAIANIRADEEYDDEMGEFTSLLDTLKTYYEEEFEPSYANPDADMDAVFDARDRYNEKYGDGRETGLDNSDEVMNESDEDANDEDSDDELDEESDDDADDELDDESEE